MVEPYEPNAPRPDDQAPGKSDIAALMSAPATARAEARAREGAPTRTDLESLRKEGYDEIPRPRHGTFTDILIDGVTPCLIFFMVYALIFFLLDVRYVYTEVQNGNIRWTAFFFILGVVALNRLVARRGREESFGWMIFFGLVVAAYTFSMSSLYGVGSLARGFMGGNPLQATAFNVGVAGLLWWVVNRLTHECCVDENRIAGDVGILTGTARRFREATRRHEQVKPVHPSPSKPRDANDPFLPMVVIEAYDPTLDYQPKVKAAPTPGGSLSDRLSRRHPGMSIFYFSVPALFAFAIGLRVVQHGGPAMVLAGHFYVGVYAVSALLLLMLTSLGGLRQYFRARFVDLPPLLGPFWIGLGGVMVAAVLVGATQLPLPGLPDIAYVDRHETDFWSRDSTFQLTQVTATPVRILQETRFMQYVGRAVLACMGLVLLYGALKALAAAAARLSASARLPRFLVTFCRRVERLLDFLTSAPRLPQRTPRVRVQRALAASVRFESTLSDPEAERQLDTKGHVEHAYAALCALAQDAGVPRHPGETPYEFLDRFPKTLYSLRHEARDLTRLYVIAAYSPMKMDDKTRDRLRKFWITYRRIRNTVVR